jgi:PAS domain-containing protein
VVLTFVDITERRRSEDALRAGRDALLESQQNLAAALALAEIGIWRFDPAGGRSIGTTPPAPCSACGKTVP